MDKNVRREGTRTRSHKFWWAPSITFLQYKLSNSQSERKKKQRKYESSFPYYRLSNFLLFLDGLEGESGESRASYKKEKGEREREKATYCAQCSK